MTTIMTTYPNASRRRVVKVLDIALGPLSLYYWVNAQTALTLHATSPDGVIALGALPGVLWLALVLLLARSGQTPGQALLRICWVDPSGARARWRPLGDTGFWACNAYMLAVGVALCGAVAIARLGWPSPPLMAWSLPIGAVAVVAALMAHYARRSTARLMLVSR